MTQDELAKTIKTLVEKGDQAKEKSVQFYIAASLHLITLKAEHKGTWAEWATLVRKKCGIGKSRASELMRIAGGHTTAAEVRSDKAQSMRNVRAASPQRGGEKKTGRDLTDIVHGHDAQRIVDLQRAWDRSPAEVKQEFVETNVVELSDLLAQQRKKAASAAADRAIEKTPPPHLAPITDTYPELPPALARTSKPTTH
jgi:hypothetical protein